MDKFLNFCCFIAHLPKKLKVAIANLFITLLVGAFVLAVLDIIGTAGQLEGFWKIKAVAWVIYHLILARKSWKIYVGDRDGTFYDD